MISARHLSLLLCAVIGLPTFAATASGQTTLDIFTVVDADEANPARTVLTSGTLAVTLEATAGDGVTLDGYQIVVNSSVPPDPGAGGWQPEITEFTMPDGTPDGLVTLYAWVRDSSGYVASKTCQITYCTGTEISKSGMTASGHTNDRDPSRMIDT